MSFDLDELEKLMEERLVGEELFPPFYNFSENEKLLGVFVEEKTYQFQGNDRKLLIIRSLKDNMEYAVSKTKMLSDLFAKLKVQPGDYVLIKYEGERDLGDDRSPMKLFKVAKMTTTEVETLLSKVRAKKQEIKKLPEKPLDESANVKVLESNDISSEVVNEIRNSLKDIFEFYDKMTYEELEKRLKVLGYDVPLEKVKVWCSDFLKFNENARVVEKVS